MLVHTSDRRKVQLICKISFGLDHAWMVSFGLCRWSLCKCCTVALLLEVRFYIYCIHSLICGQFFWHSLSCEGWVYQRMNRCQWRLVLLLFCPLQSHLIFLLRFECVTRVQVCTGQEQRLGATATEKLKGCSGWLAQQNHLTVCILSAIVYSWGGFGSSLCQTTLHHVLAKKMTYCVTLVYLRNVQLLTYRIYVYFVLEHLCYSYNVFLHSYGLWIPWWVCLFQHVLLCLFFTWLDSINTLFELNRVLFFFSPWFQGASSFRQNTLTHVTLQELEDGLFTGQACIPTVEKNMFLYLRFRNATNSSETLVNNVAAPRLVASDRAVSTQSVHTSTHSPQWQHAHLTCEML